MTYEKALEILGLEDGEFTYIQLTKVFSTLKRTIPEHKAEELADAYDFLRKNFKKIKSTQNAIDESIFPTIKQEQQIYEFPVQVYPIIKQPSGEYQPVNLLGTPHGKVPSLVVGDFKSGEKVATYLDGKLYIASAYIIDAEKVGV